MPDRFEENLRALLTRAYEPPPYRQEFYDALLARLKDEQKRRQQAFLLQTARRKRLALGALLAAASVAFAVVAEMLANISQPSSLPAAASQAVASAALGAKPSSATVCAQAESWPRVFSLRAIRAAGGLEYQNPGERDWQRLEAESFDFQPGMALQVSSSARHAIAHFRLGHSQTAIALQPATVLRNEDGRLALLQGGLYATVDEQEGALEMAMADRRFAIAPGSEIFAKKEAKGCYAVEGEPAPQLMVIKGEAIARDDLA
ncbi:MAG: hypothetical protein N3A66_05315, partial [Planctomycetota bacterium]|nr:hypothetical protein [Planctomycetota bacterium]